MAVINSSDLDFDQIKSNLKTYFERQAEFADYDFEAAGLSNLLDVLAYNTHLNGLVANMSINESFLNSSQLRASVTSHAEALGYYPRSQTGSSANLNLTITTTNTSTTTISIPKYTTFSTNVDNVLYSFKTLEQYIATNDGTGVFTFKTDTGSTTIPVKEGTVKTKTFIVGDTSDENVYVIPDENIDTSTLVVTVYDSVTSDTFSVYTNVNDAVRINTDSKIYIAREAPNGYFEVLFSDGNVLGQSPVAGNKIVIQYLNTSGADANGGTVFTPDSQINIDGTNYDISVVTVNKSSGGAAKETIASIKANAPVVYATQQRLITAEDYKALIQQRYSSVVKDVTAWGGNDNVPPEYGKVFVSLNFKDGTDAATQQITKDSIVRDLTKNLSIMSIDTKFSDPVTTFLEFVVTFNFDPDLSGKTVQTIQSEVTATVKSYVETNLNTFDAVFRRSLILTEVDNISPAILNSRMSVKMQSRFIPTLNTLKDYTLNYPVELASPDDVNHRITSTRFTFQNQQCFIQNQLNSNKLQIIGSGGNVVQDNIGSYERLTGTVNIRGFKPTAFEGSQIKVSATPANESTIRPLRGYILGIDAALSVASGIIDTQNTAVTL
jgi:hypothetical protein